MDKTALKPVLIVLIDGFADWETPLISGVGGDFYGLRTRHATPDGGDVTSMGGLRVTGLPEIRLQGDEVIVLCGSDGWTGEDAPNLADMLRDAHGRGQTIAAICGATLALARAGLLDGRRHTSNGLDFLHHWLPDYAAADDYQDVAYAIADDGIITASGTAPVTFAAEVLRAAGLADDALTQFRQITAAEHSA